MDCLLKASDWRQASTFSVTCVHTKWPDPSSRMTRRALYRLGVALYRAGRLDQAEALIQLAIAAEPDRWDYHKALGNVYKHQGRIEKAEAHLVQGRIAVARIRRRPL